MLWSLLRNSNQLRLDMPLMSETRGTYSIQVDRHAPVRYEWPFCIYGNTSWLALEKMHLPRERASVAIFRPCPRPKDPWNELALSTIEALKRPRSVIPPRMRKAETSVASKYLPGAGADYLLLSISLAKAKRLKFCSHRSLILKISKSLF